VRILLDARMHRTYPRPADSLGRLPGIEVRRLDMARIAGGVQHAKFMRVDGREVFVGSQNLDWRALKHIHELGVRVRDERVAEVFGRVFELDWAAADSSGGDPLPALRAGLGAPAGPPAPIAVALGRGDTARVWPLASPRGFLPDSTRWDLPAIVRLLDSARSEAALQLLQYSPESRGERDATLDDALRRAAARGVRVRLLISDWVVGGRGFTALRSLAGVPGIEVRISSLPEWSGGYIPFARVDHSKYLVVDSERLWIGTSNWEPGYFTGSRNLGLVLAHPGLAASARRVFESGWGAPGALTLEAAEARGPRPHGEETPPGRRRYGG
jgi:phosphatidylserine/phosphatidylglycerophosphate/cardiolipin synthase-like enzyme